MDLLVIRGGYEYQNVQVSENPHNEDEVRQILMGASNPSAERAANASEPLTKELLNEEKRKRYDEALQKFTSKAFQARCSYLNRGQPSN
jgi:hypothetical protein